MYPGGGKLCGRPALEKMRKKCGKMRKYAEKYAEKCGLCIWRNLKGLRKNFPAPGKKVNVFGMAVFWSMTCNLKLQPWIFSAYFFVAAYFCTTFPVSCFVSVFLHNFFVFWLWIPMQKCWHHIFCADRIKQILFADILKSWKNIPPGNVNVKKFKSF